MAGVDRLNQMHGSYQFPYKCFKWYHTLFHRAREIALANGYIIYCKASERNKLDPVRFRQSHRWTSEDWEPPSPPPLGMYEDKKCKPDCEVCSERKSRNRHQTSYYCKQCNIPSCVVPCFKLYHTLWDYKV